MPKKTPSEFVTREEAAKMLGVTTRTIDRYADEKRLTRYKASIGRRILFKRSEVERLRDEPPLSKE